MRFSVVHGGVCNPTYLYYLAVLGRRWVVRIPAGAPNLERFSDAPGVVCNRNYL